MWPGAARDWVWHAQIMEDEKRPRRAQIVRFLYFCTGVVIMGLGIALTTRSGLGTSPISAPMWVLAIRGPWSFGQWTFAINTLFVILQFVLLRLRLEAR